MPTAIFEDKDLLNAIGQSSDCDMSDMIIVKKEIIDNQLEVVYRSKR